LQSNGISNGLLVDWLKRRWLWLFVLFLAVLAYLRASSLLWVSDDAYASFRYADNWARGFGLVFNIGERVEGITNPLWTLILGVLARWGFDVERSATTLGLLAYVICIPLALLGGRTSNRRQYLPLAAIFIVADTDFATFASGGLETSLLTASVLASFVVAWHPRSALVAGAAAGLLASVSGMLRPDGTIFVPVVALAFCGPSRRRGLAPYLLTCLPLLAGFHGWRRFYYGGWFPNTYYAKSAFLSWWSQGAMYLGYFSQRHVAMLGIAILASGFMVVRAACRKRRAPHEADYSEGRRNEGEIALRLVVAWAMILVYTLGVVRVGGDFMYARLLVPVIPLIAVAAELSLSSVLRDKVKVHSLIGIGTAVALFIAPSPVDTDIVTHYGIVDERAYYQNGIVEAIEGHASILRRCTQGYPVRVAIYGGELRLAYRARFATVIEAHAGLTDPVIAHGVLKTRQRVGHEKSASAAYLVLTKRAHFATSPLYAVLSDTHDFIPELHADLCGVDVRLLHWDPDFVKFVRTRGATVPDYPAWLDQILARVDFMPDLWVQRQWEMAQHFYFLQVSDPGRAQVFATRLQRVASTQ
jgi:hypothetical protein